MDRPRPGVSARAAREAAVAALRTVVDPELGLDLVELGLVYGLRIDETALRATLTLTTRGCPLGQVLLAMAEEELRRAAPDRLVEVALAWEPPWSPAMLGEEGRRRLGR